MTSSTNSSSEPHNNERNLFFGDSQMATLIRGYDWKSHPLGPPEYWPLSLKTGLRMVLNSAHPMFIWWSDQMYMFHNDSYVPLMGNKHPGGLGSKGYEVWAETWPQLGAVLEGILKGEKAFYGQELLVPMSRKGFMEDSYWTFSYSPMFDDNGQVNGIFCACNEVTDTVLPKRRLKSFHTVSESIKGINNPGVVCQRVCDALDENPQDVPFSLIYLLVRGGSEARLQAKSGHVPTSIDIPAIPLDVQSKTNMVDYLKVVKSKESEIIDLAPGNGSFSSQAVIIPILQPESNQLYGFFIFGLNSRLSYDPPYQDYHKLLGDQLATSISSIRSWVEIERQKARLERFFMQAPGAICILDGPELVFELVNPGYQKLFPSRQLLGKSILEALPEIEDNPVFNTFKEVYKTGGTHEEQALLIPFVNPEDGKWEDRYFKFIQQARYDENGEIDGVLVFSYEVTDLVLSKQKVEQSEKRLQTLSEDLAALNEELRTANEEILARNDELAVSNQQLISINSDLDNFIYTASHDLKAPISNIEGLLGALLRSLPPDVLQSERNEEIINMMQRSIERFKKTIFNLTEITKLQKDHSQEPIIINLSETVREVVLDMEPMIKSSNAQIEVEIDDCYVVEFSPKNLRSVIYNLLSNAIKYKSPERIPSIKVNCEMTDEFSILSVADNGLGMDLSDSVKIFAMFKRLHNHVEGSGIGLYMDKRVVENAGGKIELESKLDEGSTFKVYFKR